MLPSFIHYLSRARHPIVVVPEASRCGHSPARYRMAGWLAVLVVIIVIIAGSGQAGTILVTGQSADAGPASPAGLIAADQLVWVRQEPPVINANGDPLLYESLEPRFEGSYTLYDVDETNISMEERFVDYGHEFYHIFIDSVFDRPPLVLNPPLRYKITGNVTHSGAPTEGTEGVGARFWYSSDLASVEPQEVLAYFPWSPYFDGTNSKDWMLEAPPIAQEGQTFTVIFGWWNCAPCNVTWTYRAEPANAVEQLGVEVIEPVVKYQGNEVQPGQAFFPETCDLPDGKTSDCLYTIELTDSAVAYLKCMSQIEQILAIVERSQISELKKDLVMYIAGSKLMEQCLIPSRTGDDYELDFVLSQGALLLESVIGGQIISVHTQLGTATAAEPGAFGAGYDPDSKTAAFISFAAPLTIQTKTGAKLVLQPAHRVELTAAGFGPVTSLPRIFLPMQIR